MKPRHAMYALVSGFILACLRLVNRDFYYDEILTIIASMLGPAWDIVTEYTTLNTHPLFSLLGNAYLRAIGVTELGTLFVSPWILRLPLLVIPVVSLVLIGRFLRGWYGVLAALLLATATILTEYQKGA